MTNRNDEYEEVEYNEMPFGKILINPSQRANGPIESGKYEISLLWLNCRKDI